MATCQSRDRKPEDVAALSSVVEWIGPAQAAEYLKANTNNFRTIDVHRVMAAAEEMKRGNWKLNGEAIKFSVDGSLLDGQHRLSAIVKSGRAVRMLVVRGIECGSELMDRGKSRTIGQYLRHEGVKNYSAVAAISRACVAHDAGFWDRASWPAETVLDSQILAFARKHHAAMQTCIVRARPPGINGIAVGAVLFVGTSYEGCEGNDLATWFLRGIEKGDELSATDAVFVFRSRMAEPIARKSISLFMQRMLLTIAWNKTVKGEDCTSAGLRVRLSGPNPSALPRKILTTREG